MGHVRARIKAANARAEAQLAAYEKSVLLALEETESALVGYGKAQAQSAHLLAAAEESRKAVKLARLQYDSGVGDFLNVLDAQRTQFAIEDELARSETLTVTSLVAVYKALGGGPEQPRRNQTHRK
jgi:multidrug efflux system outer membrane protein